MLRPLGRGLRDTLDNQLPFILTSFAWWVSLLLIVTAPAGTIALFALADPRRLSDHLRPERDEILALVRRELLPAWLLALAFAVPTLILVANVQNYADASGPV